jgi:hypothetical protein
MDARDQFLAHSDVGAANPKSTYLLGSALWSKAGPKKIITQFLESRRADEFISRMDEIAACIYATHQFVDAESQRLQPKIESILIAKGKIPKRT